MKILLCVLFTYLNFIFFAQTNWSIEDLHVTTFRNGDTLMRADSPELWMLTWDNYIPAYSCTDGDCSKGILYNWAAVFDTRGLAPLGYRIPSLDDLKSLNKKETFHSKNGWINDGTGNYFNAYPKGNLSIEGNDYFGSGYAAYYWTSSKSSVVLHSVGFVVQDSLPGYSIIEARREDYFSVRCIRDETESKYFDSAEAKIKDLKNETVIEANKEIIKNDSWNENNDLERKQDLVEKKQKEETRLKEIKSENAKLSKGRAVKLPFTSRIKNEFSLNISSIKKVQFYTSGTIILEPVKENKKSNISSGNLYLKNESQNRVIIPINTPCIIESLNSNGSMNVRFESAAGSILTFTPRGTLDSKYYLTADWSNVNSNNWVVTYQNQKYRVNSTAGTVYLMVKMKGFSQKIKREKIVGGIKI